MKNMKKLASLLLVLVMVFALAAPAMAVEPATVTINIDTPKGEDTGEKYTVYRIFDATVNGELSQEEVNNNPDKPQFANVSYSIATNSLFYDTIKNFKNDKDEPVFALKNISGDDENKTVVLNENVTYDAAALAKELKTKIGDATEEQLASVRVLNKVDSGFEVAPGYYMILSSLGSNAVIDTVGEKNMTIQTKNDLPTLTKKITKVENGNANDGAHGTASYGSVVTYTITVNVPASANAPITVHDLMDTANMTFDGTITKIEAVKGIETTDITGTSPAFEAKNHVEAGEKLVCNYEYEIAAETVAAHLGEDIKITYNATVNDGAETATALKNSAFLTYSNYTSTPVEVDVTTYEFDLVKTTSKATGNKLLDGASFQLYDAATDGTAYNFKLIGDVYHFVPVAGEGTTDTIVVDGGIVRIKGLAANTYYLEETVAPDGYNRLDSRFEFNLDGKLEATVTDGNPAVEGDLGAWTAGGVHVENLTGLELPSTGGIGTTLFYIVGGLLIVGAAVLLITKKRVNGEQ